MKPQIQAVCFDGFGTLVQIVDKRRPFKTLLGNMPSAELVTWALTMPSGLDELASRLAISIDKATLAELEADLNAERQSTQLRPGIEAVWIALQKLGLKVAVCSNLAMPYGNALVGCLPSAPDALVLSYEVGLMKPQAEIYHLVCRRLSLQPDQILFVGDSVEADVHGPQAAGLLAIHIEEFEAAVAQANDREIPEAIANLVKRVRDLGSPEPEPLPCSPEQALDLALGRVNASASISFERNELLRALRTPVEMIKASDPALQSLLRTFFDTANELLLIRIAEGKEVTWADLAQAVQVGLRPGNTKRVWIAARAIRSMAVPS